MEKIQYEAARIATGATKLISINNLEKEIGWDTLEDRRRKHKLILFYKMSHNLTPDYLSSLVPPLVGDESRYNLRNATNLQTPHARTKLYSESFLPSVVREWNVLPIEVRNSDSVLSFKKSIIKHDCAVIPSYYYVGKRREQLLHTRLRTNCSSLNLTLFQKNIVDSPLCHCGDIESVHHYLLTCPLYRQARLHLSNTINPIRTTTVKLLLNGDQNLDHQSNVTIFQAVHSFILNTKRFT